MSSPPSFPRPRGIDFVLMKQLRRRLRLHLLRRPLQVPQACRGWRLQVSLQGVKAIDYVCPRPLCLSDSS